VIKWPVKLYARFFPFFTFFQNPKKHDFLRFFELLHTFSRTVFISDICVFITYAKDTKCSILGVGNEYSYLAVNCSEYRSWSLTFVVMGTAINFKQLLSADQFFFSVAEAAAIALLPAR